MERQEINTIQSYRGYPCLTITLSTHRHDPDNRQDPIRVKNLVEEATKHLIDKVGKREMSSLFSHLEKAVESIDYPHTLDGLAIFANQEFAKVFYLPFPLPERMNVGENFLTRDLVFAMNRHTRYWVLVLSEQPTRLYEGTRDTLVEIKNAHFPCTHEGPGGSTRLPGGAGISRSAYRDDQHRAFFREVDQALGNVLKEDPLPVVLVGVDRLVAFFKEVTQHSEYILTTLQGSHDSTSPHELSRLVWPLVESAMSERRLEVLQSLEKAMGEQKVASGIEAAWIAAEAGRGHILLVEKDFHFPAKLTGEGQHLHLAEGDPNDPSIINDAVDEVIEKVLSKQGRVVFLPSGQLEAHQRIALVLRY